MLNQRHLKEVVLIRLGSELDLSVTEQLFDQSLKALNEGGPAPLNLKGDNVLLPPAANEKIRDKLREVKQKSKEYRALIAGLSSEDQTLSKETLSQLQAANLAVHIASNQAVTLFVAESRSKIDRMLSVEMVIAAIIALLLVILSLFTRRAFRRLELGLGEAKEVTIQMASGDLRSEMLMEGEDEVGCLAETLNEAIGGLRTLIADVASNVQALEQVGDSISTVSDSIEGRASSTSEDANEVAGAVAHLDDMLQTIASAMEEMHVATEEISRSVTRTADTTANSSRRVLQTREVMSALEKDSETISSVVVFIQKIAGKTKLLALNATIEAARAGEVGQGFGVVAEEVKGLADATAKASDEITQHIERLQQGARRVAASLESLGGLIFELDEYQGSMAAAIMQQTTTVAEISNQLQEGAGLSQIINAKTSALATSAESAKEDARNAAEAATTLEDTSTVLQARMAKFEVGGLR